MEAVIATGGKQYRVAPGQVIRVERLGKTDNHDEREVAVQDGLAARVNVPAELRDGRRKGHPCSRTIEMNDPKESRR